MFHPVIVLLSMLAAMLILLGGLKLYKQKYNPHTEVTRKILHVLMGMLSLTFPVLFHDNWPVVLLAVLSSSLLLLLKHWTPARRELGDVFCKVNRVTWGEPCFALGVALVFCLRGDNNLLYYIPVLILTFSDTLSALVGMSCGKRAYTTRDGFKTREGSLAFFASAGLFTWLLLELTGTVDHVHAICIAIVLSGLVTLFEAISWKGLDNLFIPASSFALLKIYLVMAVPSLLLRMVVATTLVAATLLYKKRTTLDDSAIIGSALVCYIGWALGGWQWLVPPLAVLLIYRNFLPAEFQSMERRHSIGTVLSVSVLGFFWLWLSLVTGQSMYFQAYALAYAIHIAMIGIAHLGQKAPSKGDSPAVIQSILGGWLVMLLFCLTVAPQGRAAAILFALLALPFIACAVAVFLSVKYSSACATASKTRWISQITAATFASLLSTPLLHAIQETSLSLASAF